MPMTDRSLRRSRLKGSRIAPVSHESRASRTEPSPAAANRVRNERTSAASDTSSAARSLDHAWYQRYHQFFSSTEHDHQSRGTHCLQWTQLHRTTSAPFAIPRLPFAIPLQPTRLAWTSSIRCPHAAAGRATAGSTTVHTTLAGGPSGSATRQKSAARKATTPSAAQDVLSRT